MSTSRLFMETAGIEPAQGSPRRCSWCDRPATVFGKDVGANRPVNACKHHAELVLAAQEAVENAATIKRSNAARQAAQARYWKSLQMQLIGKKAS